MTPEQIHELLDSLNLEHPEEMHESINELTAEAPLGFVVCEQACSFCGHIALMIHPVGMKYPCDCGNCGRRACYISGEMVV